MLYCPCVPIAHVCPIVHVCPIAHVPYCPMYPIPQGPPYVSAVLTKVPFTHVPHCPCATLLMCQKDVKLSKRCQMSKTQTQTMEEVHKKKINCHNEVHTY